MSILESLVARPVPLRTDADGVLRVGNTRVRLETVLSSFANGVSAEEILLKYPSLNLTDIYSVITYYLWHQEEIDAYLRERQGLEQSTREEIERMFPPHGIRERLLARSSSKG